MKYIKIYIPIFILIAVFTITDACQFDWECGSPPFTVCQNRIKVMQGLGYDKASNKVIFVGRMYQTNQVVVASVPASEVGGDVAVEYPVLSDINVGSGFSLTYGLQAYVQSTRLPYTIGSQRLSQIVGPYFNVNATTNGIWYPRGFQLGTHFDEAQDRLYYCDFSLNRLSYIPTSFIDYTKNTAMLSGPISNQFRCTFLGRVDSNLYLIQTSYDPFRSNIIKINSDCAGCPNTALTTIASLNMEVMGFAVNDKYFFIGAKMGYYSNDSGVYQLPLNGDVSKLNKLANGQVQGLVLNRNILYFSTTDEKIYRYDLTISQQTLLYASGQSVNAPVGFKGSCGCARGFTGANCQTCSNGIVRWTNGNPECVPLLPNGQPSTCVEDYECGDVPKAYCAGGTCACRTNFTGNRCQNCAGTVTWNEYGYPSCSA